MQFNAKSWSFQPNLCLAGIYKKKKKEKEAKSSINAENVSKNAMSRHRLKNVGTSHSESQSS